MIPPISQNYNFDHKKILLAIIILALIIRVFLSIGTDNFNHSDEVYQIYEQAHRLVFGYGMITWEYRYDARSWIVPGLTAELIYPFKLLGLDDPRIYIPGVKILFSILSLIIVISAYQIGRKLYGIKAGLWAAFLCAIWYDLVYFSIRPLSEIWAIIFFIGGIALYLSKTNRLALFISAGLVGMAGIIRINYVPVILFVFLYHLFSLEKNRTVYLFGFLTAMITFVLFEWLTLGYPNISHYNLYLANRTFFMEGSIGTTFSYEYLMFLGYNSSFLFWPVIIIGLINWKQNRFLILIVMIILISHILIPAKNYQSDYRHIVILLPMILIISGSILSRLTDRFSGGFRLYISIGMILAVLTISTLGALGILPAQTRTYAKKTFKPSLETIFENRDQLKTFKLLSQEKDIVGIYDMSQKWFRSGSYYYLHQNVPIYYFDRPPANMKYISHFLTDYNLRENNEFELIKRIGKIRVYKRTDSLFKYIEDPHYTYDIYQQGIDDLN